jgi:hypothetical protein
MNQFARWRSTIALRLRTWLADSLTPNFEQVRYITLAEYEREEQELIAQLQFDAWLDRVLYFVAISVGLVLLCHEIAVGHNFWLASMFGFYLVVEIFTAIFLDPVLVFLVRFWLDRHRLLPASRPRERR